MQMNTMLEIIYSIVTTTLIEALIIYLDLSSL